MRYFEFTLITSAKEIEENTKIKLREYSYDSPIAAVNCFMHKTMKNNVTFLMYREESDELVSAAFTFDERKYSYDGMFQGICTDPAESGLIGIKSYIYSNQVQWHIHASKDKSYEGVYDNGTREKGIYLCECIEI